MSLKIENLLDKWASIFNVIGHPMRLAILLALHGSKYTGRRLEKCLKLNEIREVLRLTPESNEKLIYHVNKLIEAGLVERTPAKTESGEWDRHLHYRVTDEWYRVTDEWIKFANDFDITEIVEDYFKKRG